CGGGTAGTANGGNPAACPAAEPRGGDACSPADLHCSYGHCNDDGTGGISGASCTNGQWSIASANCDAVAADAGPPCAQSSDCGSGSRCLFKIADGCAARGGCFP